MTRRQFIRNILMTGCTITTYPLLSYQIKQTKTTYVFAPYIPCVLTPLRYEIYKSIRTCINYIHNVYKIPFDEHKNPFLVSYYIPKEIKPEDNTIAFEISEYISKIYKYNFYLVFNELPMSNGKYSSEKRCRLIIPDIDKKYYYTLTFILNSTGDKIIDSIIRTKKYIVVNGVLYPTIFHPPFK